MGNGLFPYPLTAKTVHLCLDIQRIFAPGGLWATPWMERVLPVVTSIASRFPERTVFTRFITPQSPVDMPSMWGAILPKETTRERIRCETRFAVLQTKTSGRDH
jgi:nicotinamidase-related amidase